MPEAWLLQVEHPSYSQQQEPAVPRIALCGALGNSHCVQQDALALGADRLKPPSQELIKAVHMPARERQHLESNSETGQSLGKSVSARASQSCSSSGAVQGCLEDTPQIPVLSLKLYSKTEFAFPPLFLDHYFPAVSPQCQPIYPFVFIVHGIKHSP